MRVFGTGHRVAPCQTAAGLVATALLRAVTYSVFTLEPHSLHHRIRNLLDRHLLVFSHCAQSAASPPSPPQTRTGENQRLHVLILPQHPYEQLRKVARVYELTQWLA